MGTPAPKAAEVIRLKVILRAIRPPIWRRLEVPSRASLRELHHAIQAAMGWGDQHLYAFEVDGRQYGDPARVDDVTDDTQLTVLGIMRSGVKRFNYIYDFGDTWEHQISIEGKRAAIGGRRYPTCVAGKRNCPPEDCGGIWGYRDFLAALANPSDPKAEDWSDWMEGDFDPEEFSIERVNARIGSRLKLWTA
ncbi:MAG: plasmid pRiA4b ORF-3 family protein [Deltaproteobacteria bacterium]|nr:plasmid pRiA4b ORF-3 family protein [Deltaproteobacteria bacterium]